MALLSPKLCFLAWDWPRGACQRCDNVKYGFSLNKDILHKLLTIMWTDYSESVRSVAAETIGVKGHGNVSNRKINQTLSKLFICFPPQSFLYSNYKFPY
eukprot:sb/3478631/